MVSSRHVGGIVTRMAGLSKNDKSGPHCWGREVSTQFACQFVTAVTAPPLVGCVVWNHNQDTPVI